MDWADWMDGCNWAKWIYWTKWMDRANWVDWSYG